VSGRTRKAALALLLLGGALEGEARAAGLGDFDETLRQARDKWVDLRAFFRTRGELLHNLDLDRGPTPSGELFFPVPLSDPKGQLVARTDVRLRADLSLYLPSGGLALHTRIDALDNLALGSDPLGVPATSTGYAPENGVLRVKRLYAEALTPIGLLSVGRMANQWGLGMLANGGDCEDCDSGDAADRAAFVTPLAGHLWALAYDLTAAGPLQPDKAETRVIDVDPTAMVHSLTFAFLSKRTDLARRRRTKAGRTTVEYGAYVSHRFQENDVPATYLPTASPIAIDGAQVVHRGFRATAADAFVEVTAPGVRVAAEGAYVNGRIEQVSLLPGITAKTPVTSNQWGVAFESSFGASDGAWAVGFDAGAASGDSAPGFGAFPKVGAPAPLPGDLDGAQANPPFDTTVDNFRFHPDYRVDRILFRELVGTLTDAAYLRPHARVRLWGSPAGSLEASVFAVASFALSPTSAPGGDSPLGVELDPGLRYTSSVGFAASLEQATLFPLSGLANPALGLGGQPAQLWRLRLVYRI
jgi:uncharacterized protein (TIGR04551 family)